MRRRLSSPAVWALVACLVFGVLTLLAVTESSVALLDDPSDGIQGTIVGVPRPIRSDEWIRETPIQIGALDRDDTEFTTPLAVDEPVMRLANGPATAALHVDRIIGKAIGWVSAPVGFAFLWNLPLLLFWVFVPWWLTRMGVRFPAALALSFLVFFAPSNLWWSGNPGKILAWSCTAAWMAMEVALALKRQRHWMWGVLAAAVSMILLAKLAAWYPPWVIPLGMIVLLPTAVHLAFPGRWNRSGVIALTICALGGIGLLVMYFAENGEYFSAILDTAYPGQRRVSGEAMTIQQLFGAPFLTYIQIPSVGLIGTNASEITSGFLVLGLLLLPRLFLPRRSGWTLSAPARWALGLVVVLGSWCSLTWPAQSTRLLPLSLVPPARLAQVVGLCMVIAFALALAGNDAASVGAAPRRGLTVLAITSFLLLGYAGSHLRMSNVPAMPVWFVWLIALVWSLGLVVAMGVAQ